MFILQIALVFSFIELSNAHYAEVEAPWKIPRHEAHSFLKAPTRNKRSDPICNTDEYYCEANKASCMMHNEQSRELYCVGHTCTSTQACYLSTPCPAHYALGCTDDQCLSFPCHNGATCQDTSTSYNCQCVPGWDPATDCATDLNECQVVPCLNGGSCNNLWNAFTCDCTGRYEGTVCETDCRPGPADIVFVVDTSDSLQKGVNKSVDFIKEFISQVSIGPNDFQIGVITYNFDTTVLFDLDDYTSASDMSSDLNTLRGEKAATYTATALRQAREMITSYSMGSRGTASYIVLMHDGLSTDRNEAFYEAQIIHSMGIRILSVGIGQSIAYTEMLTISNSPFYTYSPNHLDDMYNQILKETVHTDCTDCNIEEDTQPRMITSYSMGSRGTTSYIVLMHDGLSTDRNEAFDEAQIIKSMVQQQSHFLSIHYSKRKGHLRKINRQTCSIECKLNSHLKTLKMTITHYVTDTNSCTVLGVFVLLSAKPPAYILKSSVTSMLKFLNQLFDNIMVYSTIKINTTYFHTLDAFSFDFTIFSEKSLETFCSFLVLIYVRRKHSLIRFGILISTFRVRSLFLSLSTISNTMTDAAFLFSLSPEKGMFYIQIINMMAYLHYLFIFTLIALTDLRLCSVFGLSRIRERIMAVQFRSCWDPATDCADEIDECASNPCQNGGTCTDMLNDYSCSCSPGYSDKNCQTDIDECASNPCENGGTCTDHVNEYSCSCVPGYTGSNCQTDMAISFTMQTDNYDECGSNPCQNGGTCTDHLNGYSCSCAQGFNGNGCQTDIDECASNPCQHSGTCTDQVDGYICSCDSGYDGTKCAALKINDINEWYSDINCQTVLKSVNPCIHINECDSNPCQNAGTCTDQVNAYMCTCDLGYTGVNCQIEVAESLRRASHSPFLSLIITSTSYVKFYLNACKCSYINECASNPCENGGSCTDNVNGYTCTCVPGYIGTNCQTDMSRLICSGRNINECASSPWYSDINCQTVNDDFRYVPYVFYIHGVRNVFVALELNELCRTVHINECDSHPCQNGGTCIDQVNAYMCTCDLGYTGVNCQTDINECASNPCENGGSCTDNVNRYTCSCVPGYIGTNCQTDNNECTSNPCQNSGTCTDHVNGYSCSCVPGYTSTNCQTDINECASDPCQNGGTCTDQVNAYMCTCDLGYGGVHCETDINECASNPCGNGGSCTDNVNRYTCSCVPGYIGTNCQTDMNECTSIPCQNSGTCTDHLNSYSCSCVPGYTGTNCQTDYNECDSNPCQNSGTCTEHLDRYSCSCIPGYNGVNCQTDINECASNPCQNGGSCSDHVNGYSCSCVPGYLGLICQTDINECSSNPCQNGGTCTDQVNAFMCACILGYAGIICQTDINECSSNPCENGGSCTDYVNKYTCSCVPGYLGSNCQTDYDECQSNPCMNTGSCKNLINSYSCDCTGRYEGDICQT
ncbi:Notch, partial [Mytilus galloprovincialis]